MRVRVTATCAESTEPELCSRGPCGPLASKLCIVEQTQRAAGARKLQVGAGGNFQLDSRLTPCFEHHRTIRRDAHALARREYVVTGIALDGQPDAAPANLQHGIA